MFSFSASTFTVPISARLPSISKRTPLFSAMELMVVMSASNMVSASTASGSSRILPAEIRDSSRVSSIRLCKSSADLSIFWR